MCYFSAFRARCPEGQVVIMKNALYGRMKPNVCYEEGSKGGEVTDCTSDVLHIADEMCSGAQHCTIQIPNEAFEKAMPCLIKGYFDGSYGCLSGMALLT